MKKFLNEFEVYLGTVCSIAMVAILFANVVGRYVMHSSIKWAEEVCLMLFILSIYFGAACCSNSPASAFGNCAGHAEAKGPYDS